MDLKRLTELIGSLHGALLGTGGQPGDAAKLLKNEAGQLAWEFSEQLGPRTKEEGNENVVKDAKRVFFPIPPEVAKPFADKQGSRPDFLWLFATKQGPGMLVGASTEDILGNSNDLRDVFYRANRKRGATWQDLGDVTHETPDSNGRMRQHRQAWRGRQHAVKINRVVVTTFAFNRLLKQVQAQVGQLRASFGRTAQECAPSKRIPGWVKNQIENCIGNGKSIFEPEGLSHPTSPFIAFGSRAKGVESNPYIARKIHAAVVRRQHVIADKLGKVLSGYKYNLATGQVFKSQVKPGGEE